MKKVGAVLMVLTLILFSYALYDYVDYRIKNAVSDAAFVRSDTLSTLSFKVDGKILRMAKQEGDRVEKGEAIAMIDDSDFKIKKDELLKKYDSLKKEIEALRSKKERIRSELEIQKQLRSSKKTALSKRVEALRFKIESAQVRFAKLNKDYERFARLFEKELISKGELESIQSKKSALEKEIDSMKQEKKALLKELEAARDMVKIAEVKLRIVRELEKLIKAKRASLEALSKSIESIQRKIEYCILRSPLNGRIAKRFVSAGAVVESGYPIYAVVDPKALHIEVLLSEKKLKGVEKGNRVKIKIDAFEDREYYGKVESILPASASTFSLVPRDIASGEFTKLDQRFVVRISIDDPTPDLRVGMGAEVAIERR